MSNRLIKVIEITKYYYTFINFHQIINKFTHQLRDKREVNKQY